MSRFHVKINEEDKQATTNERNRRETVRVLSYNLYCYPSAVQLQQVPTESEIMCGEELAFGGDAGLRGGCVLSQSS